MLQVEVLRVAREEGLPPTWEKPMGVVGANASQRVDGNYAIEVEPWPKHAPGQGTLTPKARRGPDFSPS
jgi:hypothetical protein